MGFKHFVLLALSGAQAWAESSPAKRQTTTAKYCPGGTQICFSEWIEPKNSIVYRIAIPDVSSAPFDVLLQIVAPIDKAGWTAVAWGGTMNFNPLTVAWSNGGKGLVSSRWSTARTVPGAYAGATYAVLPTSTANATHWQVDVLCTGCSQWEGGSLNPNGVNKLAWAKSTSAMLTASSNTSSFSIHDAKGTFSHDFSAAKIPKGVFDALVYGLDNPSSPETSSAPATSPPSSSTATRLTVLPSSSSKTTPVVVSTRVTELPKPSTSSTSKPSAVTITTRVTQLPPTTTTTPDPIPTPTTRWIPDPPITKTTTPAIVTVTVTARPPTTTTPGTVIVLPPWLGGGPPWGKGKGGGGGKRGGWKRSGRDRLAAPPEEYE